MKMTISFLTVPVFLLSIFSGCAKNSVPTQPGNVTVQAPSYSFVDMIDDCNDNDNVNARGGTWYTYDDTKGGNNGNSQVFPANGSQFTMSYTEPTAPDMPYAARMWGTLRLKFAYPLIGMGTNLSMTENPIDLNNYTGFKFMAKRGTGDQVLKYRVSFKSHNISDPGKYQYYGFEFTPGTAWQQYTVKFSSGLFTAVNFGYGVKSKTECLSVVQAIQFQTNVNNVISDMNADMWVDKIELFKE